MSENESREESRWPNPDLVAARLGDHVAWVKNLLTCLEEDIDYGKVKGADKDCLFKPGQEKIADALDIDYCPIQYQFFPIGTGIYVFCHVTAFDRKTKEWRGEGFGGGWIDGDMSGQRAAFQANKETKMPDKRAKTDCVINIGHLSAIFTQDMEEAPPEEKRGHSSSNKPAPYAPSSMSGPESPGGDYEPPEGDPFAPPDTTATSLTRKQLEDRIWKLANNFDGETYGSKCGAMFKWLSSKGGFPHGKMTEWGVTDLQRAVRFLEAKS